jgi:hypothetical protein
MAPGSHRDDCDKQGSGMKDLGSIAAIVIHRRRIAACIAALNLATHTSVKRKERGSRHVRRPFQFEDFASSISDRFFRRMYRMSRDVFNELLNSIELCDVRNTRSDLATKLSMTLRYLAGGSYLDICVAHCLPVSSFFANCDEIIRVIDKALHIRFDPSDLMWNEAQSRAFGRGVSPLSGCVGAID